tara:strand:+ start:6212 stop:6484 length:273 start_codon:yes stop_codon:yes gene_type:complete
MSKGIDDYDNMDADFVNNESSVAIKMFMHCQMCMEELPEDKSPQEYVHMEAGINFDNKLQINCVRHDLILGTWDIEEKYDDEHCCSCEDC